jgi:hypothetical protein
MRLHATALRSHDSSAIYSTRNASIGSTRAARKAGIRPARLERINPEHRQMRSHFTKGGASEGSHCHPIAIGTNRQTHAEKGGTTYIDGAVLRQSRVAGFRRGRCFAETERTMSRPRPVVGRGVFACLIAAATSAST